MNSFPAYDQLAADIELGFMKKPRPRTPIADRFWPKVNKDGPIHPILGTRCWEWQASRSRKGYGYIGKGGRSGITTAYRASWEIHYGPIPDGLCVLHRCDNPPCVNPAHLFLGTKAENTYDMDRKGRRGTVPRKAHCKRGHPRVEENLRKRPNRGCRICYNDSVRMKRHLAITLQPRGEL